MKNPKVEIFDDGYAFCCDSTDPASYVTFLSTLGVDFKIPLIVCDPPYGNVVKDKWDRTELSDASFSDWMIKWTRMWTQRLELGGAFYVWGGIGRPGFRPFIRYLSEVENDEFQLANLITWSKKRAYGVKHNYLFTREELAYFVKGDIKKPRKFNIPLLDVKRGYAGFNSKYPAKSEFYRRTNVWSDVTEIMQGKVHVAQKAQRVIEIPIEVHTDPGEWVLDMFAGSGTTAHACRKLGRKFIVIERDEKCFDDMVKRLKSCLPEV
jgi:DNA modification methylase